MSSPSRQEVVTQLTEGVVVTKSTEGRHTVDQWSCRHQVGKKVVTQSTRRSSHCRPMELPSPSRQEGGCHHQVDRRSSHSRPMELPSPSRQEGRHTVDQKEWGYQVNPRSGDTKSTQQWGHQVNPRSEDTNSTQEWGHQVNPGAGTPSQPTEKGRGHTVDSRNVGDTESTQ
jgi:hypothetical protein